jgi:hypothetical protein
MLICHPGQHKSNLNACKWNTDLSYMLSTKGLSGSMDSAMIGGTSCAQGQLPGWLRQGRYAGGSTKIKHVCVYEVCVTYIYIYLLFD